MAFNFFRKKETTQVVPKVDSEEGILDEEQLAKVDGGYQKTQDDINKILSESDYIASKKEELDRMLAKEENTDEKSYSK